MKTKWAAWVFAFLFLSALGAFGFEVFWFWKAMHSGMSPFGAAQATQQKLWHFVLNPWVFTAYLSALVALLWNTVSVARKHRDANLFWIIGAFLAAILVLVTRFIQAQLK